MKKTLFVQWRTSPATLSVFIRENRIKQKDIVSINRIHCNGLEIWYWSKKFCKGVLHQHEDKGE